MRILLDAEQSQPNNRPGFLGEMNRYGVEILQPSTGINLEPARRCDRFSTSVNLTQLDGIVHGNNSDSAAPGGRENNRLPTTTLEALGEGPDARRFLEEVCGYHRLRCLLSDQTAPTLAELYGFQGRTKYELMAHDPAGQKKLGQLLSEAKSAQEVLEDYVVNYRQVLSVPTTRRKHVNVLEHIAGHLPGKTTLRDSIQQRLDQYRSGIVPWSVPFNLLRRFFRHSPFDWLTEQSYLFPGRTEYALKRSVDLREHTGKFYRTS